MNFIEKLCNTPKAMIFFDKENILILRDNNYTQPFQLRNTLMSVRMDPAKKSY
jgi:hypothetical protein